MDTKAFQLRPIAVCTHTGWSQVIITISRSVSLTSQKSDWYGLKQLHDIFKMTNNCFTPTQLLKCMQMHLLTITYLQIGLIHWNSLTDSTGWAWFVNKSLRNCEPCSSIINNKNCRVPWKKKNIWRWVNNERVLVNKKI